MNINKVTKNSVIITDTAVPIAKYSGINVNKRIICIKAAVLIILLNVLSCPNGSIIWIPKTLLNDTKNGTKEIILKMSADWRYCSPRIKPVIPGAKRKNVWLVSREITKIEKQENTYLISRQSAVCSKRREEKSAVGKKTNNKKTVEAKTLNSYLKYILWTTY